MIRLEKQLVRSHKLSQGSQAQAVVWPAKLLLVAPLQLPPCEQLRLRWA